MVVVVGVGLALVVVGGGATKAGETIMALSLATLLLSSQYFK